MEPLQVGELYLVLSMMFGGKTTYLLRVLEAAGRAVKCLYINHSSDKRSSDPYSTHNALFSGSVNTKINATFIQITNFDELSDEYLSQFKVVCVDEGQFFKGLVDFCLKLVEKMGCKVYVAALSGTYERKLFGEIGDLIPLVDDIIPLRDTLCQPCSEKGSMKDALYTHRKVNSTHEVIEIGSDNYMPVCRSCYLKLNPK